VTSHRYVPNANDRAIGYAITPEGVKTHVLVDGAPLCPWTPSREFTPIDGTPPTPLCQTCDARASLLAIELPREVAP
jgi:hypothetical protein